VTEANHDFKLAQKGDGENLELEITGELVVLFILESTYEDIMRTKMTPERFEKCVATRSLYPRGWDVFSDFEKKKEVLMKAINTEQYIRDFFYIGDDYFGLVR